MLIRLENVNNHSEYINAYYCEDYDRLYNLLHQAKENNDEVLIASGMHDSEEFLAKIEDMYIVLPRDNRGMPCITLKLDDFNDYE